MSERKYRQRGYQDEPRGPREHRPAPPRDDVPRGRPPDRPRAFNMPGFREVVRCARCGHQLTVASAFGTDAQCARCGADLHACAQCTHFDTGAAFECQKPVPVRISPKDARNTCSEYEPRTTVERETTSAAPASARQAFDDLFK